MQKNLIKNTSELKLLLTTNTFYKVFFYVKNLETNNKISVDYIGLKYFMPVSISK